MHIQSFFGEYLEVRTYLLTDESTKEAVFIDAPEWTPDVESALEAVHLKAILCTHSHYDHIAHMDALRDRTHVPLIAHHESKRGFQDPDLNFSKRASGQELRVREADIEIQDENYVFHFGETYLKVCFAPGHLFDSIIYYNDQEKVCFTGDVILAMTHGRMDLPGADPQAMTQTLERLMHWDKSYQVYAGHGAPFRMEEWQIMHQMSEERNF